MTDFTVEATTAAVTDGDWSRLRNVTDLVPGTFLIEDPDEPVLVFPVEATSPTMGILFVDGILTLVELDLVSMTIKPAPEDDSDDDAVGGGEPRTDAEQAVTDWMERVPAFDRRIADDGSVERVPSP